MIELVQDLPMFVDDADVIEVVDDFDIDVQEPAEFVTCAELARLRVLERAVAALLRAEADQELATYSRDGRAYTEAGLRRAAALTAIIAVRR